MCGLFGVKAETDNGGEGKVVAGGSGGEVVGEVWSWELFGEGLDNLCVVFELVAGTPAVHVGGEDDGKCDGGEECGWGEGVPGDAARVSFGIADGFGV